MPTEYTVNSYFLGSLSDDAGKEGSTVSPALVTFTDVDDDGFVAEGNDLLLSISVETMKDESILILEDGGTVTGWYVEIEVGDEKLAYFVPTDGTIPSDDILTEDIDLQGDQSGNVTDIAQVVPCFTQGSLIATKMGCVPVELVRAGDMVLTRDNGFQEVRWVGQRLISSAYLQVFGKLRPIVIRKGSLGTNTPETDLVVSPNHRLLLENYSAQLYLGEPEVLVAAKHLLQRPGVHRMSAMDTNYVHILFDQHELVWTDGAWTESFAPGPQALRGFQQEQRDELFLLFPKLRHQINETGFRLARMEIKKHELALLW
ncbi:MAG: Hint domain-containing protein [Rhodobacteraceae bacterium]|nr:Hint domain-containing protein [Paracoccaceae bacterium]